MEILALQFLLFGSTVTMLAAQLWNEPDHIHPRPDTPPVADLRPIDRFQTTAQAYQTDHIHHHYDYDYDYFETTAETTSELVAIETEVDVGSTQSELETCVEGQWQCLNGACLTEHLRCNGIIECSDMSDEMNCDGDKDHLMASGEKTCSYGWMTCAIAVVFLVFF